jgi:hypothetical protein
MRKPVRMLPRAFFASPAPSQKLTRHWSAIAIDSGTMYMTAARLAAIWCAAAARVPWRAMNRDISVKEVTSTMMDRPAGKPSRANSAIVRQCGASSGRQIA